jgi:ribose 5-phosphate isomerase B
MRVIVGADEDRPVVMHVARELRERGHTVTVVGPETWGKVAIEVGREVAARRADFGVVCCWTGTGVSIAANKVHGVRAALCTDAATAAAARKLCDANVLALSVRTLSDGVATEILDAFLDTAYGGTESSSLEALARESARPHGSN